MYCYIDGSVRWKVRFSPPCSGLGESTAISFMTAITGAAREYDSILLDSGTRYVFDRVIPGPMQ